MKTLCAAVLAFESIIVLLAIVVAVGLGSVSPAVGIPAGLVLMIACIVASASQRRRWGLTLGWVLQVLIVLTGFIVPIMFFLGGVFLLLWFFSIRVGRRTDAIKITRDAAVAAAEDAAAKQGTQPA